MTKSANSVLEHSLFMKAISKFIEILLERESESLGKRPTRRCQYSLIHVNVGMLILFESKHDELYSCLHVGIFILMLEL